MEKHIISPSELTFLALEQIIDKKMLLELSDASKIAIVKCREYLDKKLESQQEPIYGINTGFGSLCNHRISSEQLSQLQENLVKSHACGCGDEVPMEVAKLMLLLKVQSLSYGHSGVQLETVNRLIEFYNHDVIPVVYEMGSLGASGDLAPLAHMSLPLLGLGQVYYKNEKREASVVLKEMGWQPITLKSKEGLALLNGTQFMSAFGVTTLIKAFHLLELSDIISAISLEGFDGRIEPFNDLVHQVRHHKGQIETAARIRFVLQDSGLIFRHKEHVQDPYSFRCIPQVHGASKDVVDYVAHTFACEINAVTDNPTIFPDEDLIISGGNFHGQPLAIAFDALAIALAELGNISERRTYQLISGKRGLPPFLVAEPGLNSGFMIPQYAAASIVSQNKQLCTPASVDSIESSQGQEDHVSMGANAATKCYRVAKNLERVLAIELFNAAQAVEFRRPVKSAPFIQLFIDQYRCTVPFITSDTMMYPLIENSIQFLHTVKYTVPNTHVDHVIS